MAESAVGITYETVDVFTDAAFGGNPLAVVFGCERLSTKAMLSITKEFGYSETTFVLPPTLPSATAKVRIFTPEEELPFAGHPNVGTATALARRGQVFGKAVGDELVLEQPAGLVTLRLLRQQGSSDGGRGQVCGAELTAPQPYTSTGVIGAEVAAECLGLNPADVYTTLHPPQLHPLVLRSASSSWQVWRHCRGRAPAPSGALHSTAAARTPRTSERSCATSATAAAAAR